MSHETARLYLISPVIADPELFAPRLAEACRAGGVAAVLLRLAAGDERTLVNQVKALAPVAQEAGAAVLVCAPGEVDLAAVAARGGADGVHLGGDVAGARDMRERLRDGRILGVGALRSKDDAMTAGEAGADYVMFGEPRPDGTLPPLEAVLERASWWAEIFATPCVAHAPTLEAVQEVAATGVEFVAVSDAVWATPGAEAAAVADALAALARSGPPA
jgi:thiamine-phosphate pyrophosphorylase